MVLLFKVLLRCFNLDDWFSCQEDNIVLTITPDISKSKSLIFTARKRVEFANSSSIGLYGNFIFEVYYSSIVELAHALILKRGFSCSNHLCLGFFFRDILGDVFLFDLFDFCRQKRNSLVYYGSMVSSDQANSLCSKAASLFSKLDSLV